MSDEVVMVYFVQRYRDFTLFWNELVQYAIAHRGHTMGVGCTLVDEKAMTPTSPEFFCQPGIWLQYGDGRAEQVAQ